MQSGRSSYIYDYCNHHKKDVYPIIRNPNIPDKHCCLRYEILLTSFYAYSTIISNRYEEPSSNMHTTKSESKQKHSTKRIRVPRLLKLDKSQGTSMHSGILSKRAHPVKGKIAIDVPHTLDIILKDGLHTTNNSIVQKILKLWSKGRL